jgi:thiol-disulfide isomerase/thioredoxin
VTRLQTGRLTPSQEASVLGHFRTLGRANAVYRNPIERASFMARALTVGRTAPDAAGQDLQANAFRLSECRGKLVVLAFSAEWCAICRTQYPYYRFMQEL